MTMIILYGKATDVILNNWLCVHNRPHSTVTHNTCHHTWLHTALPSWSDSPLHITGLKTAEDWKTAGQKDCLTKPYHVLPPIPSAWLSIASPAGRAPPSGFLRIGFTTQLNLDLILKLFLIFHYAPILHSEGRNISGKLPH